MPVSVKTVPTVSLQHLALSEAICCAALWLMQTMTRVRSARLRARYNIKTNTFTTGFAKATVG